MPPRVASYMSSEVLVVKPWDNLAHIRRLMFRHDVGRVVVIDESEKPVGIITVTDLVNAILVKYPARPINTIAASEVMTRDVKTITPRKSVKHAAQNMSKYKIGGLPVVDEEGTLRGIITRTDIARAFAENYKGEYMVSDLAREPYAVANPYHALFHVAKLAALDPAGKVVVVDDEGKPVGIITRRDLAFVNILNEAIEASGKNRYRRVKVQDYLGRDKIVALREYFVPLARDVMSEDVITVKGDVDAAEAAQIMVSNRIGALPVVDDYGKLIALLTKHELVKAVATH